MALDELLAGLAREAAAEREALGASSRAEAARIVAAAHTRCAVERAAALGRLETERREKAAAEAARVRRATRHDVLEARGRFLDRVFAAATARLPRAGGEAEYLATLPRRLEMALACVGDAPAEIRCRPETADRLRKLSHGRAGLTVRADAEAPPGFRVVTADGALEVDATLEGELSRRRAALALELLPALDGLR